ncbi:MAG TPA: SusD/RagB family nutrient-binding outer membrane lipoprotein [Salinimicrobium sp.]|nr:SusD/RagB family nutrient-binding outer membrane lipoprotein [Salinimicrobium sp.]
MLGGVISCSEDYLDINQSPVDPTQDIVAPDLLLAGALADPFDTFSVTANDLGNAMVQNWGPNVNSWTGGYDDEFRFNLSTSFGDGIWDNTYRGMRTLQSIVDYEGEDFDRHVAIARIMRTFYYQYLVDLYGDIPYTEALQLGDNLTPAYDDDKQIYRELVIDLDESIAEINGADGDATVGIEDIVFQGDMSKWIQFANTLKLRLLVRQTVLAEQDAEVMSYLNEQFANLQNNFLTEDATLNPGYVAAAGKQNPFYSTYGFDPTGAVGPRNTFTVAADYAAEFLKGNETENNVMTGVFDPRVERLYEPLPSGEVVGIQQGATSTTAPEALSFLGEGLVIDSSQDGYLITAAESYLLQSEAVFRGYLAGDAKALFQAGIVSSFETLGLSAAVAEAYITQSNGVNLIGWDGSANKIEAILTQKWIALNGINGMESWIEFTRTGYPDLPLPIIAEQPNRPNRLLYPASEYSNNSENVLAQNQTVADAFTTHVFWDVN